MRSGLYVRASKANPEVRKAVIRFARWLRRNYEFPVRVPVYLSDKANIITRDGEPVSASFFAPFDRSVEPYIRIATGDYIARQKKCGRDNALAAILCSLAHEIVHYQQWIQDKDLSEPEAVRGALRILRFYAKTVMHP